MSFPEVALKVLFPCLDLILKGVRVPSGQVAQLVEHRTENPGVGGSIPPLPT